MKVLPIFSASSRHRFPLRPIYAYVKTTRKGCAKIHIRHFTNTKGGAVVPTTKGVKMDLKMFNRLCKAKKLITEAYNKQLVTKAKKRQRVSDFSSTEYCECTPNTCVLLKTPKRSGACRSTQVLGVCSTEYCVLLKVVEVLIKDDLAVSTVFSSTVRSTFISS